jgi:hypothetical protein
MIIPAEVREISQSAERALVYAVLRQAQLDLRPRHAESIRNAAMQFFQDTSGDLQLWCDLGQIDKDMLQAHLMKTYPEIGRI